jgi:hypothetical protein
MTRKREPVRNESCGTKVAPRSTKISPYAKHGNTWTVGLSPPNQKILGTKNVYKVKRDPVTDALRFKVRNVVKGYIQEQGIDYDDAFAGVAADASIRCTLALPPFEEKKHDDWAVEAIDVEAAFLEGDMEHELSIGQPFMYKEYCAKRGINVGENDVIRLMMSQYRCVQSARIWSKKFASIRDQQRVSVTTVQDESPHLLPPRRRRRGCSTDGSLFR